MSTPNPKDPKKPGAQPPKPADGAKPKIPTAAGAKPPPKPPKPVATGGKPPDKKPVPKKGKRKRRAESDPLRGYADGTPHLQLL